MKKKPSGEILAVTAVTFLLVAGFHQLIRLDINPIATQMGILGIPLIFIYVPYLVTRFSGQSPDHFGFSLNHAKESTLLAMKAALVVLPLFVAGYLVFWGGIIGKTITPHIPGLEILVWNLIGISFPEEFFFRGYLQTRLGESIRGRISLWKTDLGWAVVVTAVLFALAHLLTSFHLARLAVFFPALLFGWVRERSGSILGPTLLHWMANSTLFLLEGRI